MSLMHYKYKYHTCNFCGNKFARQGTRQVYCNKSCNSKARYQRNKSKPEFLEKNRKKALSYHYKNRDKVLKRQKKYREQNKEYLRAKWREWHYSETGQKHWEKWNKIYNQDYGKEFNFVLREKIRQRDSYTCQLCGVAGVKLQIHHIDYDKTNNLDSNLVTLCASCHPKTNFRKEKWQEHFQGGGDLYKIY